MLTSIFLLIGITISGNTHQIAVFPNEFECDRAITYMQSLDERPANVFCTEVFLEVI